MRFVAIPRASVYSEKTFILLYAQTMFMSIVHLSSFDGFIYGDEHGCAKMEVLRSAIGCNELYVFLYVEIITMIIAYKNGFAEISAYIKKASVTSTARKCV